MSSSLLPRLNLASLRTSIDGPDSTITSSPSTQHERALLKLKLSSRDMPAYLGLTGGQYTLSGSTNNSTKTSVRDRYLTAASQSMFTAGTDGYTGELETWYNIYR